MNSRQRRTDKRKWKYKITTSLSDYEVYLTMWDWLVRKYGRQVSKCGWRERFEVDNRDPLAFIVEWEFLEQKAAVEFALKWS